MTVKSTLLTAGFLLSTLVLTGCPSPQTADDGAPPVTLKSGRGDTGAFKETDPWLLTTTDPNANRGNHGIFLGNGYAGATFDAKSGMDNTSVCYVGGFYDRSENLEIVPSWPNTSMPEASAGEPYQQTLDLKKGTLFSNIRAGRVETFLSVSNPHLAVSSITLSSEWTEGKAAQSQLQRVTGFSDGKPTEVVIASLDQHPVGTNTTHRYVAIYTSRDIANPQKAAQEAVEAAAAQGFDKLLERHQAAWQKLWQDADIQIEGDPEAQQLVHKLMFDLLQSTRPGASDSIAPESLSGDFYKGHIFWDAEVWMFPALLAQHPEYARSLLDYRFKHLAAAKVKAKAEGYAGADFPWESASSGKEVAPSGFSKGRHVTAGVGWAHWQYWLATQDREWLKTRGWPVISAIADFWASRAKKNTQTGKWDVLDVYGPDENKGEADNNTYTNAMARYCLLAAAEAAKIVGQPANLKWKTVAANLTLPFDKKGGHYLARQNDEGKATKQADGELVIYPAALPMDGKTAEATFDFNSKRPIKNGPAMTDAMHALIAARLGRAEEAEQAFRDSYRPFVRGPFLLFSEKRSLDRCVFTTGAGGVLQAVIYGFGGLDFSKPGGIIKGKPALPASWKKLTITGIKRGGKRYTLTVTPEKRTLTAQS
jgi:trehalose/maltose hydrolase-like predicted phosphorylase